jgi:uncharacterized protein YvpB
MILDVPYYSQFKDAQKEEWKPNACGIASLKMVLDFYRPTDTTIDDLYQKGLDLNSYLENIGWYHHGLVNIAQTLGYKGITRSWGINQETLEKLQSRRFTEQDITIAKDQQMAEALYTLKSEINQGHPIILSLPRNFTKGGSGHLVVLIGFDDQGFYFHDPDDEIRSGKEIFLAFQQFQDIFERRAIFIMPS